MCENFIKIQPVIREQRWLLQGNWQRRGPHNVNVTYFLRRRSVASQSIFPDTQYTTSVA